MALGYMVKTLVQFLKIAVYIISILSAGLINGFGKDTVEVMLADFENGIPCSECGDQKGFRKIDKKMAELVAEGARESRKSIQITITPLYRDLFYQGRVRRMYLSNGSDKYDPEGPNALSFWLKLPGSSPLVKQKSRRAFNVWSYHYRPGDTTVGGPDNKSLATDSMMHGYANFGFSDHAAGKWFNVVLSASAFQISRYYYHFYAAQATTGNLNFFPSLRQLQFRFGAMSGENAWLKLDQMRLIHKTPSVKFLENYNSAVMSKNAGTYKVPVRLVNPSNETKKYRIFISSCLGIKREKLQQAIALSDSFRTSRQMAEMAGTSGGTGVVTLEDENGRSIVDTAEEITVLPNTVWKGVLVHYLKPEMLGNRQSVQVDGQAIFFKRDTLTTSVVVWDPFSEKDHSAGCLIPLSSNADDANHKPPPGFPEQKLLPKGWQSCDIPINQVGGYFVSVIRLTDS